MWCDSIDLALNVLNNTQVVVDRLRLVYRHRDAHTNLASFATCNEFVFGYRGGLKSQ